MMGKLRRVISGGQTGVDRAGLDAARAVGLEIGGYCPRGRRAEDGRIPDIYPLEETPEPNYKVRTSLNVLNADATLIYWTDEDEKKSRGTGYTIKLCRQASKPWFDVLIVMQRGLDAVVRLLEPYEVINVAGPRESIRPGIHDEACELLVELFTNLRA